MKVILLSTNKNSLQKLYHLSAKLDAFSQMDAIFLIMQSCLAIDALGTLKKNRNLGGYDLLILADQEWDQEIAAGLAVYLKTGCLTACTKLGVDNNTLKITREAFGGLANLNLKTEKKPYVITVAASRLNDQTSGDKLTEIEEIRVEKDPSSADLLESKKIKKSVDLTSAKKIVSVGRGIDKKENIGIIEKLARAIGAEMGCSRPISEDFKWLPVERQVGLTGETVKPDLYMAIGISGQVQHVVGMRDSKIVIAINNNKNAPIFEFCDYGIVSDLFEIVPVLTEKIEKETGTSD